MCTTPPVRSAPAAYHVLLTMGCPHTGPSLSSAAAGGRVLAIGRPTVSVHAAHGSSPAESCGLVLLTSSPGEQRTSPPSSRSRAPPCPQLRCLRRGGNAVRCVNAPVCVRSVSYQACISPFGTLPDLLARRRGAAARQTSCIASSLPFVQLWQHACWHSPLCQPECRLQHAMQKGAVRNGAGVRVRSLLRHRSSERDNPVGVAANAKWQFKHRCVWGLARWGVSGQ